MARVHIACAAPKGSHRGNRATAERWASFLREAGHQVKVAETWTQEPCDMLIALHATKSDKATSEFRRVISEAITAGVPVLASRIPGSVSLLGEDYPAYLPVADARALARLIRRVETDPAFLEGLRRRVARMAPQLSPSLEMETRASAGAASLSDEVRAGLTALPKTLPSKLFYDDRGSRLFEAICELPEYYLTRSERSILERHAERLAEATRASDVIELGPGDARKTRLLLDALRRLGTLHRYVPVDISGEALGRMATLLLAEYPGLRVRAMVADYDREFPELPPTVNEAPRLAAFLGSTIGNFAPGDAEAFLRRIGSRLRKGDSLLLGADLVKARETLVAAYDDAAGVTAEFNRNALSHLNRLYDANFEPSRFDHVAEWNASASQMEMYLRSREAQRVSLRTLQLKVEFGEGERIRTEISRKFTREKIESMLLEGGFTPSEWLTSPDAAFVLALASKS